MTFVLFSLWAFVLIGRPQDLFPGLDVLRPALVLAGLTLAAILFGFEKRLVTPFLKMPEVRKYLSFFGIIIVGIPFAVYPRVAFEYIFLHYIVNLIFFMVLVILVDSIEKLKKVVMIISLSTLSYGCLGLLMGSFSDGRFKISGSMFDPNDLAYVLISIIPFGLFYIVRPEGGLKKLLSLVGIGSSMIVLLLTGSRGGLVGLFIMLFLMLMTRVGSIGKSIKIGLAVAIVLVTALNLDKINVERYITMTDLGTDYNFTSEEGRLEVWRKGSELFITNLLTGVGVNCYGEAIGNMRLESGLVPVWQTAHNSYLQVAVETGFFGLIVYVSMIASALRNFSRCSKNGLNSYAQVEIEEFRTLAGLVQISFMGSLVAAFFLSQAYSIFFILFFGLSAVMRRLAAVSVGEFSPELPGLKSDTA
jgi:O-antigen ligase